MICYSDGVPSVSYSEHSLSSIASHDECFRSSIHAEVCLSRMHSFFVKNQLTDVTLIAGRREIKAHRLVLSAGSEYFAAMFNSDLREANQSEIVLQDVDGDALADLVYYCYTGKVELREDTVERLLGTACLLGLCEVIEACCVFLKRQLHPSNAIGIYLFADSQGCTDLRDAALTYTADHFVEVIKNQEFLMLPTQEVAKIFASDELNVPTEEVIFQALMMWVNHDIEERKSEISELLSLIRLPLLSPSFIVDHVESESVLRGNSTCQQLIIEALKYHLLPERKAAMQSVRTRPRKSTVGLLYVIGGIESKNQMANIEAYNLRKDKWRNVTFMSVRRLQFGVAVIDDRIYLVGGRDGLKTLDSVECFNVASGTWTPVAPMATHRHGLGVAALSSEGGPLYAVGGHDGWSYLNSVERYDPHLNKWTFVAPMMTSRSTVGVAVLNNKLYAVGGRDGSSCLRTVECYDPHRNTWTSCSPMSTPRGGIGVAVMNGCLYALGGHDGTDPFAPRCDCVERYDPKTDTWTKVASLSIGRDAVGVALLGDRLFAVGGYDGKTYVRLVEAYDSQTNQWQQASLILYQVI
ncbi:hypothetical protein AAG570_010953 [Ranatra chinensis]|uniref:Kelch-like protein diablo n=1 Tax=Ranatra chinensis TaxID=642074 RepID=A0ABD0YJF5_9HEMI